MSGNTEATSSSDPVVTPIPDPVQIMDIDGDLTIMNEPDWDKMEGDTLKEHLQDMFKANQQLLELLNLRKQGKKEDGDIMKLKRPGPYDGKSDKLRAFIAELRYYIESSHELLLRKKTRSPSQPPVLKELPKVGSNPFGKTTREEDQLEKNPKTPSKCMEASNSLKTNWSTCSWIKENNEP